MVPDILFMLPAGHVFHHAGHLSHHLGHLVRHSRHAVHHLAVLHHAAMICHLVMMHGAALVFHHPTAHLSECERAANKQNKNADCGYSLLHFVDLHSLWVEPTFTI